MSDSDLGKKMQEYDDLSAFIIAYERVTGQPLQIVGSGECPDFICKKPNGQRIGVELTRVYAADYTERKFEEVSELMDWEPITGWDVTDQLCYDASRKSDKLLGGKWTFKRNMLVLQVYECPLSEVVSSLKEVVEEIATDSAFQQIWVAGFYEQDAYSEIDLYCIKPARLRGYHQRPFEKPYG